MPKHFPLKLLFNIFFINLLREKKSSLTLTKLLMPFLRAMGAFQFASLQLTGRRLSDLVN